MLFVLRFAKESPGTAVARLRVETDDEDVAPVEVILTGRVTGPVLSCLPKFLGFPETYVDRDATAVVVCSNSGFAGTGDDARLVLDRADVTGEGFELLDWTAAPSPGLAVGEAVTITVRFAPTAPVEHHGSLSIGGPDLSATVPLVGRSSVVPDCDAEVLPLERPGIIEPGIERTLHFTVKNLRPNAPCVVRDHRLCPDTDPAYSLPGGLERVVVPPGGEARFPVIFAPELGFCPVPGEIGCIEFELEPSADGHREIPLTCSAPLTPSVLVAPNDLDFGTIEPNCATRDREVHAINVSSFPVRLTGVGLGPETSDAFFVRSWPPAGTTIQPGASVAIKVAYRPVEEKEGLDTGTLWVQVEELAEPLVVSLRGRGAQGEPQRDHFEQGVRPKGDFLFVLDNGATMGPELSHLVADLGGLPDYYRQSDFDLHFAVTTTGLVASGPGCPGGVNGGEDGRLFPVDGSRPRVLDRNTPDLRATWEANLAVGACHAEPPQLLEAALRALTPPLSTSADDPRHPEPADGNLGFLRANAYLVVVAVSDRADASPGDDLAYHAAFQALKGAQNSHLFEFHAITGDRGTGCTNADGRSAVAGDRLIDLAHASGGQAVSICGGPWFPHFLFRSAGFGVRTCFNLAAQPLDRNGDGVLSDADGELRVFVEGAEVPAVTNGERAWRYAEAQVAVCFEPGHVPAEGAQVDIEYHVGCFGW